MSLKQWLIDYSDDVISGEIIACQKHKWACARFLRDVDREDTDSFPFVFDEDKAIRFFEWMALFKHTKGVLKGQSIEPADIQVFVFGNIYGWVHRDTGFRRFRKAYWQVGRKNAKSQSLAVVGSYELMALGESMSEVYIGATKRAQAQIVWKETEAMLAAAPDLKGKYVIKYGAIHHMRSRSIMQPLSKEDQKSGDGLNPQCGIVDEYHAHKTNEILNVLDSGMIARSQPLLMIISTAGTDLASPCYRTEYDYVGHLLDPDHSWENDTYYAMVNELDKDEEGNLIDEISDEQAWLKANPIACSYPEGLNNMRARLLEALASPEKMDDFLTKNMNVWINAGEKKYMRMDRWKACGKPELIPDLRGMEFTAGIDLSSRIDLTSIGFEFELPDGMIVIKSHSFMPENTIADRAKTDNVPYDLWVRQGWITATPGDVVDYNFIMAYIQDRINVDGWKPREFCYDPYNATKFATDMENEGFVMVEIRQGMKTLSEPTKDFREKVTEKKVLHDNNPVLEWAIGNAVTRRDHNENIQLDKEKSTRRIDPIASLINAHVRVMVNIDESSAYDTLDGIRF
jgi:phage terminase large subunit-like protein